MSRVQDRRQLREKGKIVTAGIEDSSVKYKAFRKTMGTAGRSMILPLGGHLLLKKKAVIPPTGGNKVGKAKKKKKKCDLLS